MPSAEAPGGSRACVFRDLIGGNSKFDRVATRMGLGWVGRLKTIRAADAKEVGVGNPVEETYHYPNQNPVCY